MMFDNVNEYSTTVKRRCNVVILDIVRVIFPRINIEDDINSSSNRIVGEIEFVNKENRPSCSTRTVVSKIFQMSYDKILFFFFYYDY